MPYTTLIDNLTNYIDDMPTAMLNHSDKSKILEIPQLGELPRPVYVRASRVEPKHFFPPHSHRWNQFVYASTGVLTVNTDVGCFVIPPEQALWIPAGMKHDTYSDKGAELRSLYIETDHALATNLPNVCCVLSVSPLLRELILAAAEFSHDYPETGYEARVIKLITDQIKRMPQAGISLPWPKDPRLQKLCDALYLDPADERSMREWGDILGASSRTLARHFVRETSISLREWKRRLRLFKALELLGSGMSVSNVALSLGYSSPSAFISMFRREYEITPLQYQKSNRR